jgi:hypothetical protein
MKTAAQGGPDEFALLEAAFRSGDRERPRVVLTRADRGG